MKPYYNQITLLLFAVFLMSSRAAERDLKNGYYYSSHGHATVLYKIEGDNIEWYLDSTIKSFAQGKFVISESDSVINAFFERIKTSQHHNLAHNDFEYPIDIMWDSLGHQFTLRHHSYIANPELIRSPETRVKAGSKITMTKPNK